MIVKLFNRDEEYIKNVEIFDYQYLWVGNGEHSLSFCTFDNSIEELYRILYKDRMGEWREFIVTEPAAEHDTSSGIMYEYYTEDSFYETLGDFIEERRPREVTALTALNIALENTRWTVGRVDDFGISSTNFYRLSVKEAVQEKIVPIWNAELWTRVILQGNKITKRYVDLYKNLGSYHGKRIVFNKDMTNIKRTVDASNICTALYGFGKGEEIFDDDGESTGGYGRRIDFKELNNGKGYVEDLEALQKYGKPMGSERKHIFGKVEFDQCEDRAELLELTKKEIKRRSRPNVTYECSVEDLGLDFERVNRGDTVVVKDNDLDISLTARVFEYAEMDYGSTRIKLGDYMPIVTDSLNNHDSFLDSFRSKQGVWDRTEMLKEGGLNASFLNELVAELNNEMNYRGGYVYLSDDGKGIITYDKPEDSNPTMAIQILGGSFRIANSKFADGSWNWRTIGDGNGLVADAITTGVLNASLIKAGALVGKGFNLDLNSGSFNLADKIKYNPNTNSFTIDGNTVIKAINDGSIRIAGSQITLDGDVNMTSRFTVPSGNIGNLSADKITSGTINANNINVKNLNADNLTKGSVGVGLGNSSALLPSGSAGAEIHGGATDLNTNSKMFDFNYRSNSLEVQGRINAMPQGSNHAMELNGLSLNTPQNNCAIKPWNGHIRCEGNSWHFTEVKATTLYVGGKRLILKTDGTVGYE